MTSRGSEASSQQIASETRPSAASLHQGAAHGKAGAAAGAGGAGAVAGAVAGAAGTSKPVQGLLSRYESKAGVQYYRDLAGNVKQVSDWSGFSCYTHRTTKLLSHRRVCACVSACVHAGMHVCGCACLSVLMDCLSTSGRFHEALALY